LKAVFHEATRLAIDARLNRRDVTAIVRDANGASSEAAALAIIASEREARQEDIRRLATGFRPIQRRSAMAAPLLVGLGKLSPSDLIDVAPDRRNDALLRMRNVYEQLGEAIRLAEAAWLTAPNDGTERS
jgi:hypothetical protein